MAYVITHEDRTAFKRCRRQWDYLGLERRNLLSGPSLLFDFGRAIHEALTVYYFPGMWDWDRNIVLPLALEAWHRSIREQLAEVTDTAHLNQREYRAQMDLGETLLRRYFDWAPEVDTFAPVRVAAEFEVNVPDLGHADRDLVTEDNRRVRYRGRVDALVIDEHDAYWIVQHSLCDRFHRNEDLLIEERATSQTWALEDFYLIPISGTIYNEIVLDTDLHAQPLRAGPAARTVRQHQSYPRHEQNVRHTPEQRIVQRGAPGLRRTWIARSEGEIVNLRRQFASEAADMIDPQVALYPNPSPENCGSCSFRAPCAAANEGTGEEECLANYPVRPADRMRRLGRASWGIGRGAAPPQDL